MPEPFIIEGNISGTYTHHGHLTIKGDVMQNAVLRVSDGSLVVEGDVYDGANIEQTATKPANPRMEIGGRVHDHVTIRATGSFVASDIGSDAVITSESHMTLGDIGPKSVLESGNNIAAERVAAGAQLTSGNNVLVYEVGFGSTITAANTIFVRDKIEEGAALNASAVIPPPETDPRAILFTTRVITDPFGKTPRNGGHSR